MVIIGLDPGTRVLGIGIVELRGSRRHFVHSEELNLSKSDFSETMVKIWEKLEDLNSEFKPECMAVEDGYMGKNAKAASMLDKVRGLLTANAVSRKIKVKFYSPKEVKLAVTGSGSAMKDQVLRSVQILLNIKNRDIGSDEADALAVALSHSMSRL